MSNQYLKLRRSAIPGKVPETSSIDFGEIALNTYDGLAFIKKSGSLGEEIVTIGSGTSTNISGSNNFIPVFSGSNSLVTSSIYQSASFTGIRDTSPLDITNPDILLIQGAGVSTYNLISAHSDLDDYVQVNVQNFSIGGNASSDIVATKDDGTPEYGYVNLGINGSQYSNGSLVGTNSDAYLYSLSNGNLLIGNAEAGREIIIFNGGLDAQTNSKIWIHDQGTVGINTATYNTVNPPSLQIAPANSTTYNLIQAKADTDSYLQTAITNANAGVNASSDMVAYNNIDPVDQLRGFMDVGINSTNFSDETDYPGWQGGDSYVFSDAPRLTIGGATSSAEINLYVGGVNPNLNSKLILRSSNIHSMTGSLRVTGSITALSFTGSLLGTSSYAITASYWSGSVLNSTSASYAATAALAPAYVLNSSTASMLTPYVLTSVTSSMLSPYVLSSNTGSFVTNNQTGSFITNSQTSSMSVATASFITSSKVFGPYGANSILSSSYALSASYWSGSILNSTSASYASTAALAPNYVLNSSTASMLTPYVLTSVTSSMSVLSSSYASTASYWSGSIVNATSASYAATSALAPAYVLNSSTSSMLLPYVLTSVTSSMTVLSASFAATTSLAPNYVLNTSTSSMLTPYVLTSVTASMLSPYVLSSNTASFITNSQTSSMSVLSASFASTASSAENFTVRGTLTAQTLVVQTITSSVDFVTGSTRFGSLLANTHQFTGSVSITGSLTVNGSNVILTNQTSSISVATASYVLNAVSSSYAGTASLAPAYVLNSSTSSMLLPYVLTSVTSSMTVATASYVLNAISSSYAATAALAPNYVLNSSTSSMLLPYVLTSVTSSMAVATASYVLNSISSSYSATAALAPNYVLNSSTSSMLLPYVLTTVTSSMSVATASYSVTSSLPLRGLITGSVAGSTITLTKGDGTTFDLTVAQSGTVSTASYVTSSGVFGPYGANSIVTASYALTASYVANASSFPYTGSAIITGSFTVTGSTNVQSLNVGSSQFNNTSSVTSAGTTVISQLATGSYTSCFYNYTIASASNARSGQVMSVWNGATVRYTEVTTTDIGNTATASFAVALSGANIQLNFTAPGSWTVKNISNLL